MLKLNFELVLTNLHSLMLMVATLVKSRLKEDYTSSDLCHLKSIVTCHLRQF